MCGTYHRRTRRSSGRRTAAAELGRWAAEEFIETTRIRRVMSNYKNFIQDFPVRCGQILEEYRKQAQKSGREVTHMLAIAAAALPIPFERLRKPPEGIKHPSGEKEKYEKATGKFSEICDKKFLQSVLWQDEARSWEFGEVEEKEVKKEPEQWARYSQSLYGEVKVVDILEHIRNALAHGSVFTLPNREDQIENIIFLSRIMDGCNFTGKYGFLTVCPKDFNKFLVKWIQFLQNELKLPSGVI